MRKILVLALSVLSLVNNKAICHGIYGTEYKLNEKKHVWEHYGVKVNKDTNFVELGDIIDFEIRGKEKGKLEVFSRLVDDKNGLIIQGYDLTNKSNREFKFPYK